jgi:hypothetical protein
MELRYTAKRISFVRKVGWLSVASMLAVALLAPAAGTVMAAGQSVDICHGTGSNSNPYIQESPSVQSGGATEGELTGGHSNHTGPLWFDGIQVAWGDIIPPYHYAPNNYDFPGLNWTAEGQAIFNNGCAIPTETTTTSTSTTDTSSTTTDTSSTTTESSSTSTTETSSSSTTASTTTQSSSSQSVQGETDAPTPAVTLPPTDTLTGPSGPSNDSWRILLIVGAALLASVLVLSPAKASRRG